ncbi:sigma factor-like helix-turn-helix DNA-binding protein [Nocardioides convexus]|nr:sigma factor-like helix-turn-helix DNA-binding protein [Nocardioides convexus]
MRFLQGLSIAETAAALGRSDGAIKRAAGCAACATWPA